MIELTESDRGVLLPVTAQPGARREGLVGVHQGRLKVAVTAPPERGKANTRIIQVLASALHLKKSQIGIRSGETSRQKTVLIQGVTCDELTERLTRLLGDGGDSPG